VQSVSDRYIELYERIAGEPFIKSNTSKIHDRIEENVLNFLKSR
jgi:phosphoribosylaminoimidazole-succinocarboxamide synthase